MKFIDQVIIEVRAGNGGAGCIAFRREKYVPRGGPAGGDGGSGGSVILVASRRLKTLIDFHYKHHFVASNGRPGSSKCKTGKSGKDLILAVPCGTVVWDVSGKELLADLVKEGDSVLVARGGKGGKGNAAFKSSTRQSPRLATPGELGESRRLRLELKLIAEVGLLGYPNAGKSTLLRAVSDARPKVAAYPFTTLYPHLGVVRLDEERQFIMADIPGLIEGAAAGCGLGYAFLRHVERTKVLVHLIDLSVSDFLSRYGIIRKEIAAYSKKLIDKPEIVVGTKIDLPESQENLEVFCRYFPDGCIISALERIGLRELLEIIWQKLNQNNTGKK
ncbi:MAG: GTPase ObgE [Candidatus Omnitrophica bacterium]|nr:GTPase ObgE [Candidatus Omnitrophota bacterium]MCM8768509.1 GTPase ObgE [Candidatus Omnitrophota bacterium]